MSDYSEFKDNTQSVNDLATLSNLAKQLSMAELEAARIGELFASAQKRVVDLSEKIIPEMMDSLGVQTYTTTDGLKIDVKRTMRVSISEARKTEAHAWLESHGHAGLIKRLISVMFPREQQEEARAAKKMLEATFENVKEDASVHPSTLKAFVNEQLKNGEEIPLDLFGAWEHRVAKITTK